ncbi:MAG: PDZ domain-containing protein, partial [Gammaproteobacteria bacterium]|nr:PDZ domain-containing protein [Gammaproteobacteria bacterium]
MDLQEYFDKVIRGVDDPPLADLFKEFGLLFKMHALADGETQPPRSAADSPDRPAMHVGLRNASDRVFLTTIFTHGPAHRAGLSSGDELLAINGMRVTPASYKEILGRYRAGDTIEVDVFRRDELHRVSVELDPPPLSAVRIEIDSSASDKAVKARQAWLSGA